MKKFVAFVVVFLFFMLLTVPSFADKNDQGQPDPKDPNQLTISIW